jgi:hypothetical protein
MASSMNRQQRRAEARKREKASARRTLPSQHEAEQPSRRSGWPERIALWIGIPASLVALVTFAWLYWPTMTIEPVAVLNPNNPLSAEFTFENNGNVTLFDAAFVCKVVVPGNNDATMAGNSWDSPFGREGQQMKILHPGDAPTRPCASDRSFRISFYAQSYVPAMIDVSVAYSWPLGLHRSTLTRRFTTRREADGHVLLVPDTL